MYYMYCTIIITIGIGVSIAIEVSLFEPSGPGEAADSSPAPGADRRLQPAGPGQSRRARRGRCDAVPATAPGRHLGWPGDAGQMFC